MLCCVAAPKDYKLKSNPVSFLPSNTDLPMVRNQVRQFKYNAL